MKRKYFIAFVVLVFIIGLCWFLFNSRQAAAPDNSSQKNKNNANQGSKVDDAIAPGEPAPTFDKSQYSITDPASIWIIANKQRPLNPATYNPSDLVVPNIPLSHDITHMEKQLRKEPALALEKMVMDAKKAGLGLNLQSGYRSYNFQVSLYNRYVQQQGKAVADTQSARPGHSEHQTGFAADLGSVSNPKCDVESCFGDTTEGKWLAANAYKYGFIVRYPQGMDNVTGYIYEPWHVRYVGINLATELHNRNIATLEEFFTTGNAPDYN